MKKDHTGEIRWIGGGLTQWYSAWRKTSRLTWRCSAGRCPAEKFMTGLFTNQIFFLRPAREKYSILFFCSSLGSPAGTEWTWTILLKSNIRGLVFVMNLNFSSRWIIDEFWVKIYRKFKCDTLCIIFIETCELKNWFDTQTNFFVQDSLTHRSSSLPSFKFLNSS